MKPCTFILLTNPREIPFVKDTLPHLLKMCACRFEEVLVVIDDVPRELVANANAELKETLSTWIRGLERSISNVRIISLAAASTSIPVHKYFQTRVPVSHDFRGVPMFGWIAGVEAATTDFVVHFDSDILLHQSKSYGWISEGIALIEKDPLAMFVSPLPGPPDPREGFPGQRVPFTFDACGNLLFKTTFSSRAFLMSKERFSKILPTPLIGLRPCSITANRKAFLYPWEGCVQSALQDSKYYRVHLRSSQAWFLHCIDRSSEWLSLLPQLIQSVEQGRYPVEQAGFYDLNLAAWQHSLVAPGERSSDAIAVAV